MSKSLMKLVLLAMGVGGISSLMADTLFLKDGRSVEGTYAGGNANSVRFRSGGTTRSYSVSEIDDIQFSPSTSASSLTRERFVSFENSFLRMDHPASWQVFKNGDSVTIAPSGGRRSESSGQMSLITGVTIDVVKPVGSYMQGLVPRDDYGLGTLEEETDRVFADLRQANPNMRMSGSRQEIRVDGQRALKMQLTNDSPIGGRETDWLVTVKHPQGILYMVFAAPERDFSNHQGVFQQMLNSVRLAR
ncbi:MAG: hypothetical protein HY313_03975 [Acidobacteria bacterium]|nr:hypothetical protein [Acidobacteriota bacterium]